ncbi:uncharacterized protein MAM_02706 [Metarhizium album ARSEF 1941]|uniref:Uncharacterized protein n=1 Tax=Metarhizium album (strain ARSEF 1941) TaxID=1081103 RepID=A0A0B2X0N7_METAS|nr:uncharacterized protein MAM_02706 [Metarhizium album ARSEF 1941]KHN99853.1 hypothetical protein MAM_02706 [Metarhizium album ARSEF 1941]
MKYSITLVSTFIAAALAGPLETPTAGCPGANRLELLTRFRNLEGELCNGKNNKFGISDSSCKNEARHCVRKITRVCSVQDGASQVVNCMGDKKKAHDELENSKGGKTPGRASGELPEDAGGITFDDAALPPTNFGMDKAPSGFEN